MGTDPSLAFNPTSPVDRTSALSLTATTSRDRVDEEFHGHYSLRYKLTSTGTWTTVVTNFDGDEVFPAKVSPNQVVHTFGANFFAAGTYDVEMSVWWYVKNVGQVETGWTPTTLTVTTPPAAPTITSPAAGGTVAAVQAISYTVGAAAQSAQMRVMNGASVEWDSGEYAITTSLSQTQNASFITNSVTRDIQVRVKTSGIWSGWQTRSVNVSWTPPAAPVISAAGVFDTYGIGFNHAVGFSVAQGASTPAPTMLRIYARVTGSGDPVGTLIMENPYWTQGLGALPHRWFGATTGVLYDVRAVAVAANGTSATTGWTSIGTAPVVKGVLIHTVGNFNAGFNGHTYGARVFLRYNDAEAEEERDVESALLAYAGREYPVAQYGTGGTRSYSVPLVHSKGLGMTGTDLAALRTVLEARSWACVQDRRGRTLYGRLTLGTIKDTVYGQTAALKLDVTYLSTAPPSDVWAP